MGQDVGAVVRGAWRPRGRLKRKSPGLGFVYFVEAPEIACVKIGFERDDPIRRLVELEIGCPLQLELGAFVEGLPAKEDNLHEHLRRFGFKGEWFFVSPEVREVIDIAISLMPPQNREWCLGGDEYGRWQQRRRFEVRTIEEVRNQASGTDGLDRSSAVEILSCLGHTPTEWRNAGFDPKQVERNILKSMNERPPRGRGAVPSRRTPKPRRVSGHFSLIDEHRAARKVSGTGVETCAIELPKRQ